MAAMSARAVAAVRALGRPGHRRARPRALWLACSHGDVIKAIVADALGLHLDLFQRIVADPASVTVIRYTPARPFLLRLNDTGGDLSGLVPPPKQPRGARPRRPTRTRRSAAAPVVRGGRLPADGAPAASRGRAGAARRVRATARVVGMTHQVHAFEPPERFVAGTVGAPGERTFFLQARGGGRLVSVALEKVQVSLLAEKLEELLTEAQPPVRRRAARGAGRRRRQRAAGHPGRRGVPGRHAGPGLRRRHRHRGHRGDRGRRGRGRADRREDERRREDDDEDDEPDDDLDRLRVRLTPQATRAFIDRARRVVAAGRPPCPLCGQPLDPAGHLCPRHNGYHR